MNEELETVSESDLTNEEKHLLDIFNETYGEGSDDTPIPLTAETTQLAHIAVANFKLHAAQAELDAAVAQAKETLTWQQIGDQLGTSRQAARRRFLFTGPRRRPRGETQPA